MLNLDVRTNSINGKPTGRGSLLLRLKRKKPDSLETISKYL